MKNVVNIRGKEYETVASRIHRFREKTDNLSIVTDLVSEDSEKVIMKASILNQHGTVLATGYAEEVRGSSNINSTSALENCETSAIGRALAALGYAGTEYASADEVANAVTQQAEQKAYAVSNSYMELVREHWPSLVAIKAELSAHEQEEDQEIRDECLIRALEDWRELGNEVMTKLWKAPSKGGVFTTRERALLQEAASLAVRMGVKDESGEDE
jgi:hypothetical protein